MSFPVSSSNPWPRIRFKIDLDEVRLDYCFYKMLIRYMLLLFAMSYELDLNFATSSGALIL